jgi:hypothetical protein
MKGIALFLSFSIGIWSIVILATMSPVSAGKMNGKPGGGANSAHYGEPAGKAVGKAAKGH